jgi:glycerate 2-kinase
MELEKYKKHLDTILNSALSSVDPYNLIKEQLTRDKQLILLPGNQKINLKSFKRIFLCGAGKGVAPMCKAMEELLADDLYNSKIIVKYDHAIDLEKTHVFQAGHPIPDDNTIKGTNEIIKDLINLNHDDLVFVLLTGGGSALMELLAGDISLQDLKDISTVLLQSGVTIHEINCIRKHISKIKGGQLAKIIQPATSITLALSDVVGDNLSVIASGPTFPDDTTFNNAFSVIKKYDIEEKIPARILNHIHAGCNKEIPDTPGSDDSMFKSTTNLVIGNNKLALDCAKKTAESLGFNTLILTSMLQGEAREIAQVISAIIKEIHKSNLPVKKPACLLLGGEPTVTIKGNGKGGRNQEMALAVALSDIPRPYLFLSCGSDGTDGPTDAAGALVTHHTIKKAEERKLDPDIFLKNNDAYNFFAPIGDLIKTGPTRTNVMDIMIALIP